MRDFIIQIIKYKNKIIKKEPLGGIELASVTSIIEHRSLIVVLQGIFCPIINVKKLAIFTSIFYTLSQLHSEIESNFRNILTPNTYSS